MDVDALNRTIGDEIRAARARLNLSRKELAELSGLSAKTIQRLEGAERSADIVQMNALCEVFGETVADLLGRAVARVRKE
ncbi:helix-turn-helix domain-containing protein [Rhodococcus jostii]|uniref:helix-turn-helix domain-containing protein n=1 Tax=Rhodococcus jostii TaxID=132919 RepID=UPI003634700E